MGGKAKALVGILLLAGLVWAGEEPWRTKSYREWTGEDLNIILNDSPWVRPMRVVPTWQTENPSNAEAMPTFNRDFRLGGTGKRVEDKPLVESFRGVTFYIVWNSAKTVRQGYLRAAVLRGEITEEQMITSLAQQEPEDYEISVVGQDMTPFSMIDDVELKENAELVAGKTKVKLKPSKLRFRRNMEGTDVYEVIFHFPKKMPDGKPFLNSTDQSVDFSCKVGGNILRARFDLSKMVGTKGLDF
jgi:hypothetical protein